MPNYFDEIASKKKEHELTIKKAEHRKELRGTISSQLAQKTKDMKLFGNEDPKVIETIREWIGDIIDMSGTILSIGEQAKLIDEMVLEITSLGRLHNLIKNEKISEIMVNSPSEVWIELDGKTVLSDTKFNDEEEVLELARKIAGHVGRRIDNSSPSVDARLPDGSRVHIIIPPLAMKGTTITIRKFKKEKLGIADLVRFGTISELGAKFLEGAVHSRANIVISGGTGSGKTTTLNIMSNFVPNDERIITIEDSAELQLYNDHVVKLEARPANQEGTGEYTIRMLIKDSLRMRPDRVIVGEVRDGSAIDLLQAMNTGHDGSMGTVHSNSPNDCVARLSTLVLQAGFDLPDRAIKEQIAGAVDLIVQISRLKDGSRKITHISEVVRYDIEKKIVIINDLFKWEMTGFKDGKLQGNFGYTGNEPSEALIDKFEGHNILFKDLVAGSDK